MPTTWHIEKESTPGEALCGRTGVRFTPRGHEPDCNTCRRTAGLPPVHKLPRQRNTSDEPRWR